MASGEAIESKTTEPGATASGAVRGVRDRVFRTLRAVKVPALAAGAAAVALAGAAVLMRRRRARRVLGVKLPKSLVSKPSFDGASLAGQVSRASKQIGQTSKGVGKDLERLGGQAQRIGRFLE